MEAKFSQHIEELRHFLILAFLSFVLTFFAILFFYKPLLQLLKEPLATIKIPNPQDFLVLFTPLEGFYLIIKMGFWLALLLNIPLFFYLGTKFAFPGLTKKEKILLKQFLPVFFMALFLGLVIGFKCFLPFCLNYFYKFNEAFGVNLWSIGSYLEFCLILLCGTAICLEIICILFFLAVTGIINLYLIQKIRKYYYVGAFVLGALLTPPDIFSQLIFAIPLCMGFECVSLFCKFKAHQSLKI